jgi:hypothetical protein
MGAAWTSCYSGCVYFVKGQKGHADADANRAGSDAHANTYRDADSYSYGYADADADDDAYTDATGTGSRADDDFAVRHRFGLDRPRSAPQIAE